MLRRPFVLSLVLLLAGEVSPVRAGSETLREAAGNRVQIGCAVATRDLDDPKLANLIAAQFSTITPEYELMPSFQAKESGEFTFARGDRVAAFAQSHDMAFFGHMLVWHQLSPKSLFQDAQGQPLPRDEALANLQRYIDGVVRHYHGKVKAWCVVNEALSDKPGEYLRDTPALRAIGDDYIEKAFAFAHAADPTVELYYNDYNIEQPDKLPKALRLIHDLQARNLRLDAIGIQGHWLIDFPATDVIASGLKAFSETGLKVMITELDVDVLPRTVSGADLQSVESGPDPYKDGLPEAVQQKLSQRYGDIISTLLKFPAVKNISFWGTHDGRSWLNDFPVKHRTNYPLLFDRQYQPKPAFYAVLQALQQAH